jgi:hypothetical protein
MAGNRTYAENEKRPSKMFVRSATVAGGSNISCNCGRDHYAPNNLRDSYDEDDYQSMVDNCTEEKKGDPEGVVINYEDDFIYFSEVDGKLFVDGCPCNGLRKYEDFIWKNRNMIRDYYKIRVQQELEWAEQEALVNKLTGI